MSVVKKTLKLKKLKEHNTIWHPETKVVFRSQKDKTVVGMYDEDNNKINKINIHCLRNCETWGFKYDETQLEQEEEVDDEEDEEEVGEEEDDEDDEDDEDEEEEGNEEEEEGNEEEEEGNNEEEEEGNEEEEEGNNEEEEEGNNEEEEEEGNEEEEEGNEEEGNEEEEEGNEEEEEEGNEEEEEGNEEEEEVGLSNEYGEEVCSSKEKGEKVGKDDLNNSFNKVSFKFMMNNTLSYISTLEKDIVSVQNREAKNIKIIENLSKDLEKTVEEKKQIEELYTALKSKFDTMKSLFS